MVVGWVDRRSAMEIFGEIDATKLRSSATLFEAAGGGVPLKTSSTPISVVFAIPRRSPFLMHLAADYEAPVPPFAPKKLPVVKLAFGSASVT